MRPLLTNKFQQFEFSPEEEVTARQCSPLFFAYLQNKIAAYAVAAVEYTHDPAQPLHVAVSKHEALKAQVEVLEELLQELCPPEDQLVPESPSTSNQPLSF